MNKRILIAGALLLAIVLIAQSGAWAGKLLAGDQAPALAPPEVGGIRPLGTGGTGGGKPGPVVPSGPELIIEPYDGDLDLPGTAKDDAPEGAKFFKGTYGNDSTFPLAATGKVQLGPNGGKVFYWDGSKWVELTVTQDGNDGSFTIPKGAPNPVYLAVVSNP